MADPAPTEAGTPASPDVRDRWDQIAGWWDARVGEGNATQRDVVGPATDRLLGPVAGKRVLDLACGNGHYARRLADRGASVLAVDLSREFIERARARSGGYEGRVEYRTADVTRPSELAQLGPGSFDAVVCTLAMMDISDVTPVFPGVRELLRDGGPFVWSVTHPVFNQTGATRGVEEVDPGGSRPTRSYLRVERYRTPRAQLGVGIVGQPTAHWYFERSLTDLLGPAFSAGFCVEALEELYYRGGPETGEPLSWPRFPEFPPFLIVRMRAPAPGRDA